MGGRRPPLLQRGVDEAVADAARHHGGLRALDGDCVEPRGTSMGAVGKSVGGFFQETADGACSARRLVSVHTER